MFFAYNNGLFSNSLWNNLVTHCCENGIPRQDTCNFHNNVGTTCQGYLVHGNQNIYLFI